VEKKFGKASEMMEGYSNIHNRPHTGKDDDDDYYA
jgi:hypothetical protein